MQQTVVAIFNNSADAQEAVNRLTNEGLKRNNIDISVSSSSKGNTQGGNNGYDNNYKEENNESGISRFFKSLFGNDDEADTYTKVAGRSGTVVTVHANTNEEAQNAAQILDDAGAIDVNEQARQYGDTSYRADTKKESMDVKSGNDSTSIPIIEENVQVGKREVQTGGVRLKSRIVENPVEENLRLREERVTVERNPVDRKATDADLQNFQEGEFEVTEHAEVPVVSKEARVVEEVTLNTELEYREETIKETSRKTEVDVENIENKRGKNKRNLMDDNLTD